MVSFLMDGFRSLAYVHDGDCHLISRNGNQFKSFPALVESLPAELLAGSAVLDGEIVALDRHGKTQFKDLLFRRCEPRFYAFDLLWADGEDLFRLGLNALLGIAFLQKGHRAGCNCYRRYRPFPSAPDAPGSAAEGWRRAFAPCISRSVLVMARLCSPSPILPPGSKASTLNF